MIQVHPRIFVGSELDYYAIEYDPGWSVVQCCKDPFHRAALGYSTRGAPRNDPEYLVARRFTPGGLQELLECRDGGLSPSVNEISKANGNCLILNMIDCDLPQFFSISMIRAALDFIEEQYQLPLPTHPDPEEEGSDWRLSPSAVGAGLDSAQPAQQRRILIHCNRGESRGPSVAMLFLAAKLNVLPPDFEQAEECFFQKYPPYKPNDKGISMHLRTHWLEYKMPQK